MRRARPRSSLRRAASALAGRSSAASSPVERADGRAQTVGQRLQVVAAFGHRDDAALQQSRRQRRRSRAVSRPKYRARQTHPAKRIVHVGIEAGREQDELRV